MNKIKKIKTLNINFRDKFLILLKNRKITDMTDLSTVFAGLKLKNPIIVGSSGLSDTLDSMQDLEKNGAAAIVLKSLFEEEILKELNASLHRMSSEGFLYPETVDYYNYFDSPDEATLKYLSLIENSGKNLNIPVIASINCMTSSQWTYFPRRIEQAGADALELNVFVLPSDFKRTSEENEKIYFDIIQEVINQVKIPVIVKLSYYFSNLASFLQKISNTGIQGLVLFNRFYNPDFDLETLEYTSGAVLSSPTDFYQSLRWIGILSGRVNCSLAASTGVHDGTALIKQLLAGAHAVEIASTLYKHGAEYIGVMLNELESWMQQKSFNSLDQFIGHMSQSKSVNPAAFERVQFMKYFRGFHPGNKQ
jgi:dihydroorotate dehydrogenase (fumarate)